MPAATDAPSAALARPHPSADEAGAPRRRIPVLVFGAAAAWAFLWAVFAAIAAVGGLSWRVVALFPLLAALQFGFFGLLSRLMPRAVFTGGYLTMLFMAIGILATLFVVYHIEFPLLRASVAIGSAGVFAFGLLWLNTRQFGLTVVLLVLEYLAVIAVLALRHPQRVSLQGDGLVVAALFGAGLVMWPLAAFMYGVRRKLKLRTLELQTTLSQIERRAQLDELTGVANRRCALERLRAEVARCARGDATLSVVMIDVDRFKRINDSFGHAAGDAVLQRLTQAVGAEVRVPDLLARLGGEEFLLMLPGTGLERACAIAESARARIEALDWTDVAPGLAVTFSAGVAELAPGQGELELIAQADRALYRAKSAGRNRVVHDAGVLTAAHAAAHPTALDSPR